MAETDPGLAPTEIAQPPTSPDSEEGAFTRYLRALEGSGGEPAPGALDAVWRALRTSVVRELRRSSAWLSPPSYLGVFGWPSWQVPDSGPRGSLGPLEELLTDCYAFVFLEQLPRLRAQLAVKPNVDGLVVLTLRHYLQKRRQRNDLLGYNVFKSLRLAAQQAVEAGELWVLEGDSRILNATVLASSPAADAGDTTDAEALMAIVVGWCHTLLPDLVTAAGSRRREVVLRLRRHLLDLEADGVPVFLFKDLVNPLKREVRARWAAVFGQDEGETAAEDDAPGFVLVARLVRPEERVEAQESFDKLVDCVAGLVETLPEPERTRHYLRNLWGFLRTWANGQGPESLPAARRLGELLRIPRKRLPRLWESLREMVERCRETLAGKPFEDARRVENGP